MVQRREIDDVGGNVRKMFAEFKKIWNFYLRDMLELLKTFGNKKC